MENWISVVTFDGNLGVVVSLEDGELAENHERKES